MAELASRPVAEALTAIASRAEPAAAGAACALGGAAAAALVELAAGLAADRLAGHAAGAGARTSALSERGTELRELLLGAADDDAAAYAEVAAALDEEARAAALAAACEPPLLIAECAREVAEAARETAEAGDFDFSPDAIVASELAAAAARGAAGLVAANLARAPGDPRIARARSAAEQADAACDRARETIGVVPGPGSPGAEATQG